MASDGPVLDLCPEAVKDAVRESNSGSNILGSAANWSGAEWIKEVERGSEVASAALMHGYGSEIKERLLAFMSLELTAYCDESGTEGRDFIIAGYLAPASEWLRIEELWRRALETDHLLEFHARDCYAGEHEFENREDRIEIRDKFYSIIDSANVDGFAVRIDLKTFDEVRRTLAPALLRDHNETYLYAFEAQLSFMARLVSHHPHRERIGFVFDENDEFKGRAFNMFGTLKTMPEVTYRDRLDWISFRNSTRTLPLQAADALAHRVHRSFWDEVPLKRTRVQDYLPRVRVAVLGSAVAVRESG